MSDQNRNPRETQTREKDTRAQHQYTPPSTLPDPTSQPGYKFRWIATHVLGASLATNVSNRMREGWVPVKAVDHPELHLAGNKDGNVEVGGLMLCKAPQEFVDARNEYYARQARAQVESVNANFMRQNDPRMPLFSEQKSETTRGAKFGSGTK